MKLGFARVAALAAALALATSIGTPSSAAQLTGNAPASSVSSVSSVNMQTAVKKAPASAEATAMPAMQQAVTGSSAAKLCKSAGRIYDDGILMTSWFYGVGMRGTLYGPKISGLQPKAPFATCGWGDAYSYDTVNTYVAKRTFTYDHKNGKRAYLLGVKVTRVTQYSMTVVPVWAYVGHGESRVVNGAPRELFGYFHAWAGTRSYRIIKR